MSRVSVHPGLAVLALLAIGPTARVAVAEPAEPAEPTAQASPPLSVHGTTYALAAWQWQVIAAPRLAPQLGALAISGLDVAAGRRDAPIRVLGDGAAPDDWPFAVEPGAAVLPAAPPDQRIAAGFGITSFTLAEADRGVEMLELHVRYTDGLAAWINGVEVARRALARGARPTSLAARPHGPEWETFYVPVTPSLLRFGTNTLAIEVHPSGRHDAPALEAMLVGRSDRGIVRGPVLAEVGATTATIAVETDPGTDAAIEWGTGDTLDHHATSPPGHHHAFALVDLPPHAQVRYRVHAGATQTPPLAFHTAPAAGEVIRIGIYGDVRGGHATHRRLVEAMLGEPLDLVAVTGDMVLHGTDEADWQQFFAITAPLLASVAYLPAVGNHDLGWDATDGTARTDDLFTLPAPPPDRPAGVYWYSHDLADVHLVYLDSNAYERVEQETWLAADLAEARARGVRAILAFTHDGPYSRGYHRGNGIARTRYVPILARYHVDLPVLRARSPVPARRGRRRALCGERRGRGFALRDQLWDRRQARVQGRRRDDRDRARAPLPGRHDHEVLARAVRPPTRWAPARALHAFVPVAAVIHLVLPQGMVKCVWLVGTVLVASCFHGGGPAPGAPPPPPRNTVVARGPDYTATVGDPVGFLPVDSEIVLGLDVDQVRKSALWSPIESKLTAAGGASLTAFKQLCGFDPMTTIHGITVGIKHVKQPTPDGVMVVRGLDRPQLMGCMARAQQRTPRAVAIDDGFVTVSATGGDPGTVTFAFVDASTVVAVIGPTAGKAELVAVLAAGSPLHTSPAFGALLKLTDLEGALWAIMNGSSAVFDQALGGLGTRPRAMFGSVRLVGGLAMNLRLRLDSATQAQQLNQLVSSQVGMVRGMFDRIDVSTDDADLVLALGISDQQLSNLMQLLVPALAVP